MQLHGIGIGSGIAIGDVVRMAPRLERPVEEPRAGDAAAELARAKAALGRLASEYSARAEAVGGLAAEVLQAQALMAADPSVVADVEQRIAAGGTAPLAVYDAFSTYRDLLAGMGGYLGERAADVEDVAQRAVAGLLGVDPPGVPDPGRPFILVADDLAPADTVGLDLEQVQALVTRQGGPTSHTAILAREHGLVAVVGVAGADGLADGTTLVVDASAGSVVVDPDPAQLAAARAGLAAREAIAAEPTRPGALADGTPVPLLANLGSADAVAEAVRLGAEGVGLFRTEFLFLHAGAKAPGIEAQRAEYVRVFRAFPDRRVVVRVLDAGADKPLPFLSDGPEPNPALGVRGIRALRRAEPVLRDQLAAIAAAAAECEAEVAVMAPMVATVEEAEWFGGLAHAAGLGLAGVMVETPAAALIADRLLAVCDFASIGTNDLVQYAVAADRLLDGVAALQSPWHPAVLRLVDEVGRAGAALARPVGVCGEAAADPLLAVVLVGLGATSLSMAPSALAEVRAELGRYSGAAARRIAQAALGARGAAEAEQAARAAAAAERSGAGHPIGDSPADRLK